MFDKNKNLDKKMVSTQYLEKMKIWEHPSSKEKSKVPLLVILHPYGFGPEIVYSYFLQDDPYLNEKISIIVPKGSYRASHFVNPIFYPSIWPMINKFKLSYFPSKFYDPPSWFDLKIDFYQTIFKRSLTIKLANIKQAIKSVDEILRQIEKTLNENSHLDKENVNLLGYSQGAMLALYMGLFAPKKFKNIMVMSGKSHEYFLTINKKSPENYKHLNFLICNKTQDKIMPIKEAKEIPNLLESFGIKKESYQFEIYKGNHFINQNDKCHVKKYMEKIVKF